MVGGWGGVGGAGGAMHSPNLPKRSTFGHKIGKKWGACKRVKGGGGEVQKVHFLGPESPHFGGSAPPKIDPGHGPEGINRPLYQYYY